MILAPIRSKESKMPRTRSGRTYSSPRGLIVLSRDRCLFALWNGESTYKHLKEFVPDYMIDRDRTTSVIHMARLKIEKHQNYLTKVVEIATRYFADMDAVIFAGTSEYTARLGKSLVFPALNIDRVIEVKQGGAAGAVEAAI